MHLAYLLWRSARALGVLVLHARWHFADVAGALPRGKPLHNMLSYRPHGIEDFDLYALEREPRLWPRFAKWKSRAKAHALAHPIRPGDRLTARACSFAEATRVWRSPPWPTVPPSVDETRLLARRKRTLNEVLHHMCHTADIPLTFTVTEVVQCGADKYSQVFFGVVACTDQDEPVVSTKLCLKLYDERLFIAPTYDAEARSTWTRLPS
jgi:hypothetical protein